MYACVLYACLCIFIYFLYIFIYQYIHLCTVCNNSKFAHAKE